MSVNIGVICGPRLVEHDSRILKLIRDSENFIRYYHGEVSTIILPEARFSAQTTRNIVVNHLAFKIPTLFVTRYPIVIDTLGDEIRCGRLTPKEVFVSRVRYPNCAVTGHEFDQCGNIDEDIEMRDFV